MVDTLIVEENGIYKIERYQGQNLDEYNHVAELNHDKLLEHKHNKYCYYMKTISLDDIFNYLASEFDYKF